MSNSKKTTRPGPRELASPCVACSGPTDTAVFLEGPAEFVLVGLMKMGVPERDSRALVDEVCVQSYGCDPGNVPVVDVTTHVYLCDSCASRGNFARTALALRGSPLPLYRIPDDLRDLPDDDLNYASAVRTEWLASGHRPVILSEDGTALGSYSRSVMQRVASGSESVEVPTMRLPLSATPEDREGLRWAHQIAEVITGGCAVNR